MTKWKVPVKYYSGWETRGRPGDFTSVNGVIIHHTGSDSQTDDYLKFLFVTGRASEGIPAPLCHVSTDMDGDLWVGSIGRANHAGKGSSVTLNEVITESYKGYQSPELRPGPDNTDGNAHFYGNEVRFDGGQPMTSKQWDSAVLWAAAICDHYGWSARSVIGHREWSARKPDPGSTKMYEFRAAVNARLLAGPPKTTKPPVTDTAGDKMTFEQFKAYLALLYGPDGTEGVWNRIINSKLDLILQTVMRIEDDTDDTAAALADAKSQLQALNALHVPDLPQEV